MSIRQALLASGLICSFAAVCGEDPAGDVYDISGTVIRASADRPLQCSYSCIVTFLRSNSVAHYEATRVTTDPSTGYVRLEGGARVFLKGGTEIQAEKMALITYDDGRQQLNGVELRFIPPKK